MWSNDPQSYELSKGGMYICHKIIAVQNLQISLAKQITLLFIECNTHLYIERWHTQVQCFLNKIFQNEWMRL